MGPILFAVIFAVFAQTTHQQMYYQWRGREFNNLKHYYCGSFMDSIHSAQGYMYIEPRGLLSWAGKVLGNAADRAGKTIGDAGKSVGDTLTQSGKDFDKGFSNLYRGGLDTIEKGAKGLFQILHK